MYTLHRYVVKWQMEYKVLLYDTHTNQCHYIDTKTKQDVCYYNR